MYRSQTIPIKKIDDETWKLIRKLACESARFGNLMLAGQYSQKRGWKPEVDEASLFQNYNDVLSGYVRASIERRVRGYWQRSYKNVMSGRERLACFSANQTLSIRADGVKLVINQGEHNLVCAFQPKHFPKVTLTTDIERRKARKDLWLQQMIDAFWSGKYEPELFTFIFDPMKRKLAVRITYTKEAPTALASDIAATIGPLEDGQLWLRIGDVGIDYTDRVRRLREMKEHFQGIYHRLKHNAGHSPGWRQGYRKALLRAGSFSSWAKEYSRVWTNDIMEQCSRHRVGIISVLECSDGNLPWNEWKALLSNKAQDRGIRFEDPSLSQPTTVRAKARTIAKKQQKIQRAREGVTAIEALLTT